MGCAAGLRARGTRAILETRREWLGAPADSRAKTAFRADSTSSARDASMPTPTPAKAPSMFRFPASILILIALQGVAMAQEDQQPKQDTVDVHGHPLQLSCAEWRRNMDGSWSNVGPLLVGTDTVKDVTLRGAKQTGALETKCGNGAGVVATHEHSGDHPRHMGGHRHGPPPSADGT
jgi:hypothetical protein